MTTLYLTGTRTPGKALLRFLPDFIDSLHHQGFELLTSNKQGVDQAIFEHCNTQDVPLTVYKFVATRKRQINATSDQVHIRTIYSPTWQRFRYIRDTANKLMFFHASRTRRKPVGLSTYDALNRINQQRDFEIEQFIVQSQERGFVNIKELAASPCIGTAHLYVYPRRVHTADGGFYHIGHYRIETWRQLNKIVQPGIGRSEVISTTNSPLKATLQTIQYALKCIEVTKPYKLIIHHANSYLDQNSDRPQLREILADYGCVEWDFMDRETLRQHIGTPIQLQQEIWFHRRHEARVRGLYQ